MILVRMVATPTDLTVMGVKIRGVPRESKNILHCGDLLCHLSQAYHGTLRIELDL